MKLYGYDFKLINWGKSMESMTLTDWVALYAAIVATLVFVWDIVKFVRSGPKVKVKMAPNSVLIGNGNFSEEKYIRFQIDNIGDRDTTIQSVTGVVYNNWFKKLIGSPKKDGHFFVPGFLHTGDKDIPQIIKVGETWSGCVLQEGKLVELTQQNIVMINIHGNFSSKPILKKLTI